MIKTGGAKIYNSHALIMVHLNNFWYKL